MHILQLDPSEVVIYARERLEVGDSSQVSPESFVSEFFMSEIPAPDQHKCCCVRRYADLPNLIFLISASVL